MAGSIRVLIVDDSALMRQVLTRILSAAPDIEVVGTAVDPIAAREKIKALNPDVLTLDVEMPKMDGLTFLDKLMRGHPMPVLMVSSLTQKGAETTLRALALGAVDFVCKPTINVSDGTLEHADEIVTKVRAAANVKVRGSTPLRTSQKPIEIAEGCSIAATHKVVAVGSSTGGTEALKELLMPLPADFPGIVLVQHMPEAFTRQFAARLDGLCRIRVTEARDGDRILPGHALLAPGGHHMAVVRRGMEYAVRVYAGERVNRHMPSVDVLFSSCARQLGRNALGVILTGMGNDGAEGMLEMHQAGAFTIAQDQASCVVFGMPNEAIRKGGVQRVLPLDRIPAALVERLTKTPEWRTEVHVQGAS